MIMMITSPRLESLLCSISEYFFTTGLEHGVFKFRYPRVHYTFTPDNLNSDVTVASMGPDRLVSMSGILF